MELSEKTRDDLEWRRLQEAVAARCAGPLGARLALVPASTPDLARRALEETAEALRLFALGEPLPLSGIREIDAHLKRVERQGAVDGPALRDVQVTLGAARVLRRFLASHRSEAPRLIAACHLDPSLDRLEEEIGRAVEPDGTLADDASAELRRLRTEVHHLRGRIVARLEELLGKHEKILQDRYYTLREGRYVLPVRSDAHERLHGIVHATSASGATVFVEPREIIPQGNRLKMAQGEMEREEARILAVLSDLVRERLPEVRAAADALDHADLRNASARLGVDLNGTIVELVEEPELRLLTARHPLLLLDGVKVVPNDLELRGGTALVLSGPNAGGKTVALKLLGLAALMVRAGLPVPVAEGSRAGFFHPVLTDVGDDQSIAKSLSTFSAHVLNLKRILAEAGEGALVLLDELAGSTDPEEGAALAVAVLDVLCERGAAVAVTTHYEPLKALATRDARLRNASVGFDVEAMEPTYRLLLDVPGASSALLVAARFGIPADVIDRARRVLPEQARTFDDLVRRLLEEREALERVRAGLLTEHAEAQNARVAIERELERLRDREQTKLGREAEKLLEDLRKARDEVREARKRVREERLEAPALAEVRRELDRAAETAEAAAPAAGLAPEPPGAPVEAGELAAGDRVFVPHLRSEATVIEVGSKGRLRVAAGAMKLWVDAAGLRRLARPGRPAAAPARGGGEETPGPVLPPNPDNTLDVRGLRVEEAIALIESFVDRIYGASQGVAYIVHGHGSGALRDAVREHLKRDRRYVKKTRPGSNEEGGDKMTVVFLK